jgi:catechol 2,3-dioxygenase-like lactoylglutathione lyase family enzyme
MPQTGFIDHIGIGVPDLAAAKRYYDELMPVLGLRAWFPTTKAGEFNYGPDGGRGSQIFFYQALETPPTSSIPTESCSKSSATAQTRHDSQRASTCPRRPPGDLKKTPLPPSAPVRFLCADALESAGL